ncbi:MAG: DUF2283 domain-containing protein [Nanoarchaeota archaeon]|nr:DUF2283 domain-containing protein [Nanoarchaeota archaeon]MBU1103704.1 DUF2283 domain-containing protein [Nanoarchaeota archaeon]
MIKQHYSEEDDIFTIYDSEHKPSETVEFSEFLNIDIDKNKSIVGIEVFHATEFFSALNEAVTKTLLESVDSVSIECKNYRNNWFIVLVFEKDGDKLRIQMPPLRKSEYTSPLIASCE